MRSALLALCAAACAGSGARVLSRGVLAYDVAAARDVVVTIELDTQFALVVRRGATTVARAALGPPDYDVVDLSIDDGARLAAIACLDGTVRVHDLATAAERARWRLDAAATAVALTPDGALLATGAASGVLCLRRVSDGALLHCVAEHQRRITALAATADRLASVDEAGRLVVWRLPSLHVLERRQDARPITAVVLRADGSPVVAHEPERALALTPSGLAVAGDRRVVVGTHLHGGFAGQLRGLAVSPDGRWLYVAGFTSRDLEAPAVTALRLP